MHSLWRLGRTPGSVALGVSALGAAQVAPMAYNETEVFSWGGSTFGETGHGHESTGVGVATRIDGLRNRHVVTVSAAGSGVSSAALTSDGTVFTWGCGRDARLGRGEGGGQNQLLPRQIDEGLPREDPATAVSLGEYHGAIVTASGKLYTWGKRAQGHDNPKSVLPTLVKSLSKVKIVAVSCGREHTVAIDSEGVAFGWGPNASHALGTGTKNDVKLPVVIPGLAGKRIVAVAAGREHSLFLTDAGEVYACGTEFFGQCGQSMAVPYVKTPTRVTGDLADKKVVKVFAGEYHSIAICDDYSTYLWGSNKEGTLGQGDRSDVGSPRLLEAKLDGRIVHAAAGGGHTLLLTSANKLYATGRGRSGQLGRGDELESMAAYRTEPVLVQSLQRLMEPGSRIVSIAAGRDHSLAVVERLK